jgi:hypothetical protein
MNRTRTLFRVGPVLMLIPTVLWATAWNLLLHDKKQSWYIVWPLVGFLGIAVIWHVALLVLEKDRLAYLGYALVHLPAFWVVYVFAIILATHFPL